MTAAIPDDLYEVARDITAEIAAGVAVVDATKLVWAALQAERERCAQIADARPMASNKSIAKAIRSPKKPQQATGE